MEGAAAGQATPTMVLMWAARATVPRDRALQAAEAEAARAEVPLQQTLATVLLLRGPREARAVVARKARLAPAQTAATQAPPIRQAVRAEAVVVQDTPGQALMAALAQTRPGLPVEQGEQAPVRLLPLAAEAAVVVRGSRAARRVARARVRVRLLLAARLWAAMVATPVDRGLMTPAAEVEAEALMAVRAGMAAAAAAAQCPRAMAVVVVEEVGVQSDSMVERVVAGVLAMIMAQAKKLTAEAAAGVEVVGVPPACLRAAEAPVPLRRLHAPATAAAEVEVEALWVWAAATEAGIPVHLTPCAAEQAAVVVEEEAPAGHMALLAAMEATTTAMIMMIVTTLRLGITLTAVPAATAAEAGL